MGDITDKRIAYAQLVSDKWEIVGAMSSDNVHLNVLIAYAQLVLDKWEIVGVMSSDNVRLHKLIYYISNEIYLGHIHYVKSVDQRKWVTIGLLGFNVTHAYATVINWSLSVTPHKSRVPKVYFNI